MMNIGEMGACLGPEPVGRSDDAPHIDGRVFVAAGHGSRQGINDKPNTFFTGLFLGLSNKVEELI
jgi:hypothetical protein